MGTAFALDGGFRPVAFDISQSGPLGPHTVDASQAVLTVTDAVDYGLTISPSIALASGVRAALGGFNYNAHNVATDGIWSAANGLVPAVQAEHAKMSGGLHRWPGGLICNIYDGPGSLGPLAGRALQKLWQYAPEQAMAYGLVEAMNQAAANDQQFLLVANLNGPYNPAIAFNSLKDVVKHEAPLSKIAEDAATMAAAALPHWNGKRHFVQLGNEIRRSELQWSNGKQRERALAYINAYIAVDPAAEFIPFLSEFDWSYDITKNPYPNAAWGDYFGFDSASALDKGVANNDLYINYRPGDATNEKYELHYELDVGMVMNLSAVSFKAANNEVTDQVATLVLLQELNDSGTFTQVKTWTHTVPASSAMATHRVDVTGDRYDIPQTENAKYYLGIGKQHSGNFALRFGRVEGLTGAECRVKNGANVAPASFTADSTQTDRLYAVWFEVDGVAPWQDQADKLLTLPNVVGGSLHKYTNHTNLLPVQSHHTAQHVLSNQFRTAIDYFKTILPSVEMFNTEFARGADFTQQNDTYQMAVSAMAAGVTIADWMLGIANLPEFAYASQHQSDPWQAFNVSLDPGSTTRPEPFEAMPSQLAMSMISQAVQETPIPYKSVSRAPTNTVLYPFHGYLSRGMAWGNAAGDKLNVVVVNRGSSTEPYSITVQGVGDQQFELIEYKLAGYEGQPIDPPNVDDQWNYTDTQTAPRDVTLDGSGGINLTIPPMSVSRFRFAGVTDTVGPVITMNQGATTAAQGGVYADPGATALDAIDGPVSVTNDGPIDTSNLGQVTLTYSATDAAGNITTAQRIVTVVAVVDTTIPVITLTGSSTIEVVQGGIYTELGATWTDNSDGSGVVTNISGIVDTNTPGTYTMRYNVTDIAGNVAVEVVRLVVVSAEPSNYTRSGRHMVDAGT